MKTIAILTTLSALLLLPNVVAHHWSYDQGPEAQQMGDSGCPEYDAACYVDYVCIGGTPPQVVDTVLHCAGTASQEAPDIAAWAPFYAWSWLDASAQTAEDQFYRANQLAQPTADEANTVLCDVVWSLFCSIPVVVPEHAPLSDPFGPYPGLPA